MVRPRPDGNDAYKPASYSELLASWEDEPTVTKEVLLGLRLGIVMPEGDYDPEALDRCNNLAAIASPIPPVELARGEVETSLKNLYRLVETGDLGADEMLSSRILELRAQKSKVDATIDRALALAAPIAEISPHHLRQFGLTVREKLRNGDIGLRRNYLKSVVGQVIVDDRKVTLVGSTHALHAAITQADFSGSGVRRLVQEWRALRDSNS